MQNLEKKEIIYATQNEAKLKTLQSILGDAYKILNLSNVGIESQAEEDGLNPKENALKKARNCFQLTGKSSFAMDFGLFIDGLDESEQPGPSVRRIVPVLNGQTPTDEEVLNHYVNIVKKLGGKTKSYWIRALAYVSKEGEYVEESKVPKILVDIPSSIRLKGFPMTSIQIDPVTNKYESEMTEEEKRESHKNTDEIIRRFVKSHTQN